MKINHRNRLFFVILAAAWAFDFLFWEQQPGVSFAIYVVLCLLAGFGLSLSEGIRPNWRSLLLLPPILFFAAMTFLRLEPFSVVISVLLTLGLMACLVLTFRSGLWLRYSLSDWAAGVFQLGFIGLVTGAPKLLTGSAKESDDSQESTGPQPHRGRKLVASILFGLVLSIPVLLVLGSLLAAADPVFSRLMQEWLSIDRWAEYMLRVTLILGIAYLLAGVYLWALYKSHSDRLIGVDAPWLKPFLGWVEALVILISIDLLFSAFVGVQFRYFFGGQNNIATEGFTYAEYARRGFNEMLWVAIFSLVIFLGLGAITKRVTALQRRTFSGLGIALVLLVGVILVSAFQRLMLYEGAYGFTRVRTYTHIFIFWTGCLLLATVLLELFRYSRGFGAALLLVSMGFGLTLTLLNVDALIVRQNVDRALVGSELDVPYLISLSDDAVPAMADLYHTAPYQDVKNGLGAALACKALTAEPADDGWRAFHLSKARAQTMLEDLRPILQPYMLSSEGENPARVKAGGQVYDCSPIYMD